jgi:hypothetical protein
MKILTALKHLFIPHEHNNYKPHFFRELSVGLIIIGSIFLLGFSAGSSFFIHQTVLGANVASDVLVDLTNESRLAYNESPLVRSELLDEAATLKAQNMAENEYFAHTSPTGVTPWYWFQKVGYVFLYAGENLAINFTDSKDIEDAWTNSPSHRANLLNVNFKEIGLATVSGTYKDGPTIYVVQEFGTPAVAKAHAAEVATTSPATTTPISETPVVSKPKPIATSTLAVNTKPQIPEIKGESIESKATSAPTSTIVAVIDTPELAVVKNTETVEATSTQQSAPQYSTWYGRVLFYGSHYVNNIYKILLAIIILAIITMLAIELRRQHWKHIAFGLSLVLIVTLCLLINQTFF